jgi:phospholipase C
MRVPMLVVSPWSKGGWVSSQVFDHTSVIRFLEARFAKDHPDLIETNITPWRRAVAGDLTSAFNFATPNVHRTTLPSTTAYLPPDRQRHANFEVAPPANDKLPAQEPGLRPARALPYALHATGRLLAADGSFQVEFSNVGGAAAVFQVRSGWADDAPRSYTVEPYKQLTGTWPVLAQGRVDYDLSVHGPNGFLRAFKGRIGGDRRAILDVCAEYDSEGQAIRLLITNRASRIAWLRIQDMYTGRSTGLALDPGESRDRQWALRRTFGWYHLLISVEGDGGFEQRLAGHVETGKPSASDPAMGGLRVKD